MSDSLQYIGPNLSALCSLLPRRFILTGVFIDVLRRHFSVPQCIEEYDLRKAVWKPDDTTGILIETNMRWVPELTELRPGIIIKRNAFQNERHGIGDVRQAPHADAEGNEHFTTFWTGSYTAFCIGGSGAQAELLSTEVQKELTEFGPELLKKLDLKRYQVMQVGPVAILEEAQENWAVPVTIGCSFEERWVIRPQAPRLTRVSLKALLQ